MSGPSSCIDDNDNPSSKARHEATKARLGNRHQSPMVKLRQHWCIGLYKTLIDSGACVCVCVCGCVCVCVCGGGGGGGDVCVCVCGGGGGVPHTAKHFILIREIKYKYHFLMFERNPITFEQECTYAINVVLNN